MGQACEHSASPQFTKCPGARQNLAACESRFPIVVSWLRTDKTIRDNHLRMNIIHRQHAWQASDGEMLAMDIRMPTGGASLPVIVVAHGFKGFKDWGFFPWACEALAQLGFFVVNFNFSHNGVEGNGTEFTRLDKFAANTFSREIHELREVIDAVELGALPLLENADITRIYTVGHSRGGGIVLLEGADDPRVGKVATWAAVSTFRRYTPSQQERWRRDGYIEAKNARTGQMMRLNIELLDDLENNPVQMDIEGATARLHRPLLILHGDMDFSVERTNGERLYEVSDKNHTQFVVIPKTGHTFGVVHPFEGTTNALNSVVKETAEFFQTGQQPTS